MMKKRCYLSIFVLLVHLELSAIQPVNATAKRVVVPQNPADYLSLTYYLNKCPDAEGIIQQKLGAWIQRDFTLAASLIRLHFHDCAVRVSVYIWSYGMFIYWPFVIVLFIDLLKLIEKYHCP